MKIRVIETSGTIWSGVTIWISLELHQFRHAVSQAGEPIS